MSGVGPHRSSCPPTATRPRGPEAQSEARVSRAPTFVREAPTTDLARRVDGGAESRLYLSHAGVPRVEPEFAAPATERAMAPRRALVGARTVGQPKSWRLATAPSRQAGLGRGAVLDDAGPATAVRVAAGLAGAVRHANAAAVLAPLVGGASHVAGAAMGHVRFDVDAGRPIRSLAASEPARTGAGPARGGRAAGGLAEAGAAPVDLPRRAGRAGASPARSGEGAAEGDRGKPLQQAAPVQTGRHRARQVVETRSVHRRTSRGRTAAAGRVGVASPRPR
jgi:hypothetical protein